MTPEQINIAIAESLGWTQVQLHITDPAKRLWGYTPGPDADWTSVPNYTADLNAMHEVEKTIRHGMTYVINLHRICNNDQGQWDLPTTNLQFNYVTATALQRAEAYLRTIGKWNAKD